MDGLAAVYSAQGRHAEAVPYLERSLDIRRRALGANYPETTVAMHALIECYNKLGKYDEVKSLLKRFKK
jgi:pentatricopeptide repeat protein